MTTQVPAAEFRDRLSSVRDRIAEHDADAGVWFGATSIEYVTGFDHVQTERPVMLAVTDDRVAITVPRLEVERAQAVDRIDRVEHYFDYPQGDPMSTAVAMLEDMGVDHVAADADGAPGAMGYEGSALSEHLSVDTQEWVKQMRRVKSSAEIELIREATRWGNLAHRYLADHIEVGAHPITVGQRASLEASRAMLDAFGDRYVPRTRGTGPVFAGFSAGSQAALPHGNTANRRLERGDVLITGAIAKVDGYHSELERTMFVGEPSDEQEHYFEMMLEAQTIGIEALAPGVSVADVDQAVWDYFEEQGVTHLAQHHVGHNLGLDGHEPPYLDRGNDAEIEVGHVYSIEPGIYTGDEGYRHSDTILITEDGHERLTYFPRDVEGNTIRVD